MSNEPIKLKMTIAEALEFADEWSRGMTIHEGSQGWRVVCMLLAEEVRRQAPELERLSALADKWNAECDEMRDDNKRLVSELTKAVLHRDTYYSAWAEARTQEPVGVEWDAKHLKTGNLYRVIGEAINATNAQDGQTMVIYERDGKRFVREAGEFVEKFAAVGKGGSS